LDAMLGLATPLRTAWVVMGRRAAEARAEEVDMGAL